jgi:hypothetical protein
LKKVNLLEKIWRRSHWLIYGHRNDSYHITQRGRWLETMGPVLADAATFLGLTAHELTAAQLAFQRLLEKLSQKHRMAADGRDVAQWVGE